MQNKWLVLTLLPGFLALGLSAQAGTFAPPEGCTAKLTIQSRGCTVSHFYTCERDAPGEQWRADFGAMGPVFLSKTDTQAQWLESFEVSEQLHERLQPDPADPASLDELFATGLDTFDFKLSRSDGRQTTVRGFDRMTGDTLVIDGRQFQATEFEYTQTDDADGSVVTHSRGQEMVSVDLRSFLSDKVEFEQEDGSWFPFENRPVKFFEPGQSGFGNTKPLFDCEAEAASFTPGGN